MQNIVQLQKSLENYGDQDLINEMQAPSGRMPQYLIMTELKRRKELRDSYSGEVAARQVPKETVADRYLADATQGVNRQQGIMGLNGKSTSSSNPVDYSGGQTTANRGYATGGMVQRFSDGGPVGTDTPAPPLAPGTPWGRFWSGVGDAFTPDEDELLAQERRKFIRQRFRTLPGMFDVATEGQYEMAGQKKRELTSALNNPDLGKMSQEDFHRLLLGDPIITDAATTGPVAEAAAQAAATEAAAQAAATEAAATEAASQAARKKSVIETATRPSKVGTEQSASLAAYEEMVKKVEDRLGRLDQNQGLASFQQGIPDKKYAKNMALLHAGAAMMSGSSPNAGVNIGEGIAAGLGTYGDLRNQAQMQRAEAAKMGLTADDAAIRGLGGLAKDRASMWAAEQSRANSQTSLLQVANAYMARGVPFEQAMNKAVNDIQNSSIYATNQRYGKSVVDTADEHPLMAMWRMQAANPDPEISGPAIQKINREIARARAAHAGLTTSPVAPPAGTPTKSSDKMVSQYDLTAPQ